MSNTCYDFLASSFLFHRCEENYASISIDDVIKEVSRYQNYVRTNFDQILRECTKNGTTIVSKNFNHRGTAVPSIVSNCASFCDCLIVNDALFSSQWDKRELLNHERKARGYRPISDEEIKTEISGVCQLMRSATPLVSLPAPFLKFFPFDLLRNRGQLEIIRFPSLDASGIDKRVLAWIQARIDLYNLGPDGQMLPFKEIDQKISLHIQGDDIAGTYVYSELIPVNLDSQTGKLRFRLEPKVPSSEQFENWVSQEKTKLILDRIEDVQINLQLNRRFGNCEILQSNFERELFCFTDNTTSNIRLSDLGIPLSVPTVTNASWQELKTVRLKAAEGVRALREQLISDLPILSTAKNEADYNRLISQLSSKYETLGKECATHFNSKIDLLATSVKTTAAAISYFVTPPVYREVLLGLQAFELLRGTISPRPNSPYMLIGNLAHLKKH